VTSSLALIESRPVKNKGEILAAAKIAHEFGHVNRIASIDGALRQLQNRLGRIYNRIFLSNGHNIRASRLMELAQMMGGTPLQIQIDQECWAEANALLYLRDKITTGL
jgi:hypothetical protein